MLLELEPPFDKRAVQLARRRMAKQWHPDIAPPGKHYEHQRHLQAINEAADTLESLAEDSRGGKVTMNAVKVSAAAARAARAEAGRRAYEEEERQKAEAANRAEHDPFGSRVPDHSVVHRYARCLSYPEWGVGSVTGVYFSGEGDSVQQWARVSFQVGVRTIPAGSLQFVDFSTPDASADRVQRFMTAAQHAMAEGNYALAGQRLVYARDAEPRNPAVLRLMTLAFWQARNFPAAARSVRDWARVEGDSPAVHRTASRIYEDQGSYRQAIESAERVTRMNPEDGTAWERIGRLHLRRLDRAAARTALERARATQPSVEGLLDLALVCHLEGDVGAEVDTLRAATILDPESPMVWSRYAHALARTDRVTDTLAACDRALVLESRDEEVLRLRDRVADMVPRALGESAEAA